MVLFQVSYQAPKSDNLHSIVDDYNVSLLLPENRGTCILSLKWKSITPMEEQLPVFMLSGGVVSGHAMWNAPSSPQLAIHSPGTAGVRSGCRGPAVTSARGPSPAGSNTLRALGAGERRRSPSPPQRCPQLPPLEAAITALSRGGHRGPARAATATPARGHRP